MIELCIPSALDPSLAPPGCHVVSLFTQYTPYTLAGGRPWGEQEREAYADRGKARARGIAEAQPTASPLSRRPSLPQCSTALRITPPASRRPLWAGTC